MATIILVYSTEGAIASSKSTAQRIFFNSMMMPPDCVLDVTLSIYVHTISERRNVKRERRPESPLTSGRSLVG